MVAISTATSTTQTLIEVQFKLKVPPLFDNGIASARDTVGLHCLIKRGRRSCSYADQKAITECGSPKRERKIASDES